jgi:succinate dehydrogenase / fumarate reductase cytochrome b subunit
MNPTVYCLAWIHSFPHLSSDWPCLPALATRIEENMYKGQSGMWSWLFHRIAGLGILLFLLVHIVDIALLNFGPKVYNEGIALFSTAPIRIITLALVAGLFFHSFNGVRIILIDFWPKASRFQGTMFLIVMILTILCFLGIGWYIIAPIFGVNLGNMPAGM